MGDVTVSERFGLVMRRERCSHGWSQERFAAMIEIDRSYLSSIERGKGNPSLALMERVAQTLGMTLSQYATEMEGVNAVQI